MSASRRKTGLQEGPLAEQIGFRVAQAQVVTRGLFEKHINGPLELRPVEYALLILLDTNDEVTPKQLSQALSLSAPNLTLLLDRLQERGLLQRVRSEADRRSQHVLLTSNGTTLMQQASSQMPTMEAELEAHLSKAERLMLLELLHKVAALGRA
jgi:DNA-binding MarR family transcriptional regulator